MEYRLRCHTRQADIVLGEEGYEAAFLKSEQKSHIALLLIRLKPPETGQFTYQACVRQHTGDWPRGLGVRPHGAWGCDPIQ
jgi:hypothetical protein